MNRILGGILLIIGTCLGGGMLALPVSTAPGGFISSSILLFVTWFVMTCGAFFILEVSLWLPENNNMISMAGVTIGRWGQVVAWLAYLLLLYSLLAAYIASGTNIIHQLFSYTPFAIPSWFSSLIFVAILGSCVYLGIESVDYVNRGLMSLKLITYGALVFGLFHFIQVPFLLEGDARYLIPVVSVVIASFGYATIIPSLRTYFHGDVAKLRLVVTIGSTIPLVLYLLWDLVIMGALPHQGANGLNLMASSGHPTSDLTNTISSYLNHKAITTFANTFATICVGTSFLGVALCLSDFFADGLKLMKTNHRNKIIIYSLTFLPPLLIALHNPHIFIVSLGYAGIFTTVLLVFLPAVMVLQGRYKKQMAGDYRVMGGRVLPYFVMLISGGVIVLTTLQDFHLIHVPFILGQ